MQRNLDPTTAHNDESFNQYLNLTYTKFQSDNVTSNPSQNLNRPYSNNFLNQNSFVANTSIPRTNFMPQQSPYYPVQPNMNMQFMNYMMQQMLSNPMMSNMMMNQMNMMQQHAAKNSLNMSINPNNENRMFNSNIPRQQYQINNPKYNQYQYEQGEGARKGIDNSVNEQKNIKESKISLRNPKINTQVSVPNLIKKKQQPIVDNSNFQRRFLKTSLETQPLKKIQNEDDNFAALINKPSQKKLTNINQMSLKTYESAEIQQPKQQFIDNYHHRNPKNFNKNLEQQSTEYPNTKSTNNNVKSSKIINYDDIPIQPKPINYDNLDERLIQNPPKVNYDEIPIRKPSLKQTQQQQYDEMPIKPSKKNDFDEMPIKPAKQINYDDLPINAKFNPTKQTSNINPTNYDQIKRKNIPTISNKPNAYIQAEERPIKGLEKQFNKFIDENTQEPQNNQNQKKEKVRNFLKKGTRQFLSSAKAKIKEQKIKQQDSNVDFKQTKKSFKPAPKEEQITRVSYNNKITNKPKENKKIIDVQQRQKSQEQVRFPNRIQNKSPKIRESNHNMQNLSKKIGKKVEPKLKREVLNLFNDSEQDSQEGEQLIEFISGVKLTQNQIRQIKQKCNLENDTIKLENQKVQNLRDKYCDMINILESQKESLRQELEKQRQSFEQYKKEELKKITNEKRIAQRQKQAVFNNSTKKQKQQLQNLKKEWQKEKQELKKKQNSYKILIQKQKKEIEDLKRQISSLHQNTNNQQVEEIINNDMDFKKKNASIKNLEIEKKQSVEKQLKKTKLKGNVFEQNTYKQISNNDNMKQGFQSKKKPIDVLSSNSETNPNFNKPSFNNKSLLPDYEDIKTDRNKINSKTNKFEKIAQSNFININPKYKFQQEYNNYSKNNKNNQWGKHFPNDQSDQSDQHEWSDKESEDQNSFEEYHEDMTLNDLSKIKLSIKMVTSQMIDNMFHYYCNQHFKAYQELKRKGRKKKSIETMNDKKIITNYMDGSVETLFQNGVKKETLPNGYHVIFFQNKDIKQKFPNGILMYYFNDKNVDQITLQNGINIFRFENDQVEFHYQDGTIEIRHPEGTFKIQKP